MCGICNRMSPSDDETQAPFGKKEDPGPQEGDDAQEALDASNAP
jgi:hypothetical protein